MMIEPEPALERIGQITDHISLRNGDLGFGDREWTDEEYLPNLQHPCTDGSAQDPIKIIVGDDFFITQLRI